MKVNKLSQPIEYSFSRKLQFSSQKRISDEKKGKRTAKPSSVFVRFGKLLVKALQNLTKGGGPKPPITPAF